MYLNDLPKEKQRMFLDLSNDEEFQKVFAKDEILNEMEAQGKEDTEEFQYRVDEIIVNYLVSKNKIPECQREYWVAYLKYHKPDIKKKTKRISNMERFIFFVCLGIVCAQYIESWLVLIAIATATSILFNAVFPSKDEEERS